MTVLWDGPAPQPIEKWVVSRRFDRLAIQVPITIQVAGRTHRGRTLNVSEGGLAFVSPMPLNRGQEIQVSFSLPDHANPISAAAVVRHGSGFQHGCEFWGISPDDRQLLMAFVESQKSKT
jgi:c-di-GMP-binding flagellar brake protein YcgR